MNELRVGEFEELVLLTVLLLEDDAYILRIQAELLIQAKRKTAMGPLHVTLGRLEKKEFLSSELSGATKERGGRRKRIYELTAAGKSAIATIYETRNSMWQKVPGFALKFANA